MRALQETYESVEAAVTDDESTSRSSRSDSRTNSGIRDTGRSKVAIGVPSGPYSVTVTGIPASNRRTSLARVTLPSLVVPVDVAIAAPAMRLPATGAVV